MQQVDDQWQRTEECQDSQSVTGIKCCSKSFGTFAVQAIETGYGVTRTDSPLFFCLAVDIILLILAYIGRVLDARKIWVRH